MTNFWIIKKVTYSYLIITFSNCSLILYINTLQLLNYKAFSIYQTLIKYLYLIWNSLIYFKIKYKHKIYNVKFFQKLQAFSVITKLFSHFLLIHQMNFYVLKIKKLSSFNLYMLFFSNHTSLVKMTTKIKNYLKWNIYTQRGFRFSRTRLIQKTGKISAFKSFKSKIF